jgi:hypothetical protein
MMAVEIMVARQLTYFSAWEKDHDRRCDLEAGMAKLLGARVAWACADNALQIHGGNGFALEYKISRILCDARILNIFEGAAEIQAQVIARRFWADSMASRSNSDVLTFFLDFVRRRQEDMLAANPNRECPCPSLSSSPVSPGSSPNASPSTCWRPGIPCAAPSAASPRR